MKALPRFLVLLLAFVVSFSTFTCQTPTDKTAQSLITEKVDAKDNSLLVDRQGLIRIKFNRDELPIEFAVVEIVFNNQYHGFFNVRDEIFLPRVSGSHDLIAIFSDADGNRMGKPRVYKIEVP